jgi:hypothetical protein
MDSSAGKAHKVFGYLGTTEQAAEKIGSGRKPSLSRRFKPEFFSKL